MNRKVTTEVLFTKILNPHVGECLSYNCIRLNHGILPKENADSVNLELFKMIHNCFIAVVQHIPQQGTKQNILENMYLFHSTVFLVYD